VSIWFQVVIRANDRIAIGEAYPDGSVLHVTRLSADHRPQRERRPRVMLHGRAVGEGSLFGINSVVMNGAKTAGVLIGANTLIARGQESRTACWCSARRRVVRELTRSRRTT
jgi:carbonic anhydrase/acetyltransferase-like protein (isoleucine patch superfamily)